MTPTGRFLRCVLAITFAVIGLRVGAQGTFVFSNATLPGKPRIIGPDGYTPIAGPDYTIDVRVKDPATGEFRGGLLKILTSGIVPFSPVHPLTGPNAGLFPGGTLMVPFVAPGAPAEIQILVSGPLCGSSEVISLGKTELVIPALGGVGDPPSLPAPMSSFVSFVASGPLSPEMRTDLVSFRARRVGPDIVLEWDEPDSIRYSSELSWFVVEGRPTPGRNFDAWHSWRILETWSPCFDWSLRTTGPPPPEMKAMFRDPLPVRDPTNHVARLRLDPSAGDAWFFRVYWEHWHW